MRLIEAKLPIGVGIHLVSDQPRIVEEAVGGFTQALVEAVVIVLAVSFLSLGMRAGLVVSISIPLVLAIVFVVMQIMGVTLQRISLGALIIALGLLVDDAMITVEMMVARLELGDSLKKAATFAYTSTAFPMLTGTLVTVAGFLPIGFNGSSAGEYTYSLFVVIAASLLVSWVVAVLFAPLIGVTLLPKTMKKHSHEPGRLGRLFLRVLVGAMRFRWLTVAACVGAARPVDLRHDLRAAAVLPGVRPDRDPGRLHPAAERHDRRDAGADGPVRGDALRATPTSTTGRPMSDRARCASTCRSTSSSPTASSVRSSS